MIEYSVGATLSPDALRSQVRAEDARRQQIKDIGGIDEGGADWIASIRTEAGTKII